MSDHLITLLPELQEQIFRCCCVSDLKKLSCCNSAYNLILKETLWQKVAIPWEYVLNIDPTSPIDQNKLSNLRFTRTLRFIVNVGWHHQGQYMNNYRHVLTQCNPLILHTLVMDRDIDAYATSDRPFCFEEVDIECIRLTVQVLSHLRKLNIMYMKVSEESLQVIGQLNLTELNMCDHSICDYKLNIICERLPKLRLLNIISNYSINNIGLVHIVNLKSIEELSLSKCSFTDIGLALICSLTSLKRLDLNRCHNITDQGIPFLMKLVNLQTLDLSHCFKMTDAGVFYLKSISTLQHINLNYCMKVTDFGVLQLTKLSNLKCLKIASTVITDKALEGIGKLRFLVKLNITRCRNISNDGILHLQNTQSLRKLNISGTKINSDGIQHLHKMKNLRDLHISGCHFITDEGLSHLQGLTQLQSLDISYTKVTNIGLMSLTSMTSLRTLKCHHAIFCSAVELPFRDITLFCKDSGDEQDCRGTIAL